MGERNRVLHQIVKVDPSFGYSGQPVIDATALPEGHLPGKFTNSRQRTPLGWVVTGRGISARVPREGMMVERNPMT